VLIQNRPFCPGLGSESLNAPDRCQLLQGCQTPSITDDFSATERAVENVACLLLLVRPQRLTAAAATVVCCAANPTH
jgi:hypothetical protein